MKKFLQWLLSMLPIAGCQEQITVEARMGGTSVTLEQQLEALAGLGLMLKPTKRGFNQLEWTQHYKAALMLMMTMVACCILLAAPLYVSARYAGMVLSISPAIYMTGYLYLYPNSLRSSSGSLLTAVCLVAFLWLNAIGITAASLFGIISTQQHQSKRSVGGVWTSPVVRSKSRVFEPSIQWRTGVQFSRTGVQLASSH
jgi:hypothetical protein